MTIIRSPRVRGKVSMTCDNCGKVFERYHCKTTRRFCSRTCSHEGRNPPVAERFWTRVDKSGGPDACWLWLGSFGHNGYGSFSYKNKTILAHRKAYELTYGPIAPGEVIRHKVCDNPPCCNPGHLLKGTTADNSADARSKGRHAHGATHSARLIPNRPRGAQHPMAKLTASQVAEIKERLSKGEPAVALALEFGVSRNNIYYIRDGRIWT